MIEKNIIVSIPGGPYSLQESFIYKLIGQGLLDTLLICTVYLRKENFMTEIKENLPVRDLSAMEIYRKTNSIDR